MSTLAERVAAGATWLDEHVPGWEHRIDLAKLNLKRHVSVCARPGIRGARSSSVGRWGHPLRTVVQRSRRLLDYGFSLTSPSAAAWHDLQGEWVALIKARFDSGTLSG